MDDFYDISRYISRLKDMLNEYVEQFCPTIEDPVTALDYLYGRGIVCWSMRHDLMVAFAPAA